MASEFFDNPPTLTGTEEEQLRQLQRYLNTMSEKLNVALMQISIDQLSTETQEKINSVSGEAVRNQYEGLKSMIVKTAEIVRHEMDEITTHLEDNYDALSEQFGEYERNLTNDIRATADGLLQEYGYSESIKDLQDETKTFQKNLSYYIFTGLLDDTGQDPIYGIAIGEEMTTETGELNNAKKMATFTTTELAFWVGEAKVAFFSNSVFHIAQGEVSDYMKMGNHTWKVMTDGSMALISG